jgi:hypothetical protein
VIEEDTPACYVGPKPQDTTQAKAIRRVWSNGALELRILYAHSPRRWIKVLPKEFTGLIGSMDSGTTIVYLALDRCLVHRNVGPKQKNHYCSDLTPILL